MPRLLAYFCHPDDAEILVGGTLHLLKEMGWELGIATMTAGDRGSATMTRDEATRVRFEEAKAAAARVGAWYACTGLQDMEVLTTVESSRRVVEIIRRFNPDVVLAHSPIDYMLDHEEASKLVRHAAFAAGMPLYQTLQVPPAPLARGTPALYYSDPIQGVDPMGERVYPQFYVDISNQVENKARMLECHASQRDWLRSYHGLDHYILQMQAWGRASGKESGAESAEGFRQHLGHGYPSEPVLQKALGAMVKYRLP